jgi:hypothetical protein
MSIMVVVVGFGWRNDESEIVGTDDFERGSHRHLAGLAERFVAAAVDADVAARGEHGEGLGGFSDQLAGFGPEGGADGGDFLGEESALAELGSGEPVEFEK